MSGEAGLREAVRAVIRASRAQMVEDDAGSHHVVHIEVPFNEWVDMAHALKEAEGKPRSLPPRAENRAGVRGGAGQALGRPDPSSVGQGEGLSLRATGAAAGSTRETASSLTPGRPAVSLKDATALSNPAGRGGAAGLFFQDWQL